MRKGLTAILVWADERRRDGIEQSAYVRFDLISSCVSNSKRTGRRAGGLSIGCPLGSSVGVLECDNVERKRSRPDNRILYVSSEENFRSNREHQRDIPTFSQLSVSIFSTIVHVYRLLVPSLF